MVSSKIFQDCGISTSFRLDESNKRRRSDLGLSDKGRRHISMLCCVPATNTKEIFIEIRVGNFISPKPLDVPSNYAMQYRIVVTDPNLDCVHAKKVQI